MKNVFGEKLRAYRKEQGMKIRELAATSGVSETYISHLERGKIFPRFKMVLRLSKALGIEMVDLIPSQEEVERHEEKISA